MDETYQSCEKGLSVLPELRKEYELFPPVLLAHPVGAGLRPVRSAQEEGCHGLWWPWRCRALSCCCPMAIDGSAGQACKAAPQEQQPRGVALWAVLKHSKQSSSASPNPSLSLKTTPECHSSCGTLSAVPAKWVLLPVTTWPSPWCGCGQRPVSSHWYLPPRWAWRSILIIYNCTHHCEIDLEC